MQIFHLPRTIRGLVFDIDLTLYDDRAYYDSQTTLLVERLAAHLGLPFDETLRRVEAVRQAHADRHGGHQPSLGNTFLHFGVSIEENARWRAELFHPERHLKRDPRLAGTLETLGARFHLAAATNNTTVIGERTLEALGVRACFPLVIGLDMTGESKPSLAPFRLAAERFGLALGEMISIGDRYNVDIELPVQQGMGGILVEDMEDVYALPDVLLRA